MLYYVQGVSRGMMLEQNLPMLSKGSKDSSTYREFFHAFK